MPPAQGGTASRVVEREEVRRDAIQSVGDVSSTRAAGVVPADRVVRGMALPRDFVAAREQAAIARARGAEHRERPRCMLERAAQERGPGERGVDEFEIEGGFA